MLEIPADKVSKTLQIQKGGSML